MDATFGLKNKNKSKKVQKFVESTHKSIMNGGNQVRKGKGGSGTEGLREVADSQSIKPPTHITNPHHKPTNVTFNSIVASLPPRTSASSRR